MKDVLVTGAAGFVGAALVRDALRKGLSVAAVVRPETDLWRLDAVRGDVEIAAVDLVDPKAIKATVDRLRPRVVFHLAAHGAYSWQQDTTAILSTCVLGTAYLLEACNPGSTEAFVHAGSSSEYGFKAAPSAEDQVLEPNSVYAVGKAAATHLVGLVGAKHPLAAVTGRLYSAYGPWEDPGRLIPRLVAAAREGSWPPLASRAIARDFVFIDDVVSGLWALADAAPKVSGGVFNICSGRQETLAEVVAAAAEVFEVDAEPRWGEYAERDWDTSVWIGDPERMAAATGWRANTPLRAGLRAFGEWMGTAGHGDRYEFSRG